MIIENSGINKIILDIITKKIKEGKDVNITGFGKFHPIVKCNHCGQGIEIGFKGSIRLKEALNYQEGNNG